MELIDRDKLVRRMKKLGISQRELARAAGWKSHTYMRRLVNGEARTLNTDPALRIAHYLQLDVDDLFVTKVSPDGLHHEPVRTHRGSRPGVATDESSTLRARRKQVA